MGRILALVVVAGCSYSFTYDNTHYRCTASSDCPSGQSCIAGLCGGSSSGGDGGVAIDAPTDGAMPAGPCGKLAMLRDDFTTSSPWWIPWTDGAPTTAIASGHLAVTIPAGSSDLWAGYDSYFRYDMTESSYEVTVSQLGGVDTVVEIRDPASTRAQILFESGMLAAVLPSGGGTKASLAYSATAMRHVRFRESAGTLYWEYSADGSTWLELYHQADPILMDNVMAVLSAGGELASQSEAHFDDVNVALPAMPACAAETLVDSFTGTFAPHFDQWNDPGATIAVTGGDAVVTTDGTNGEWAGFASTHAFSLVNSAVYVDMKAVPQASPYLTYFQIFAPNDTETRFEMNVDGSTLSLIQRIAATNTNTQTVAYSPLQQRYWRVHVANNTVYFDTAPDAVTWTQCASFPLMLDASVMQVGAGAGEYGATSGNTTHIGGVNTP